MVQLSVSHESFSLFHHCMLIGFNCFIGDTLYNSGWFLANLTFFVVKNS